MSFYVRYTPRHDTDPNSLHKQRDVVDDKGNSGRKIVAFVKPGEIFRCLHDLAGTMKGTYSKATKKAYDAQQAAKRTIARLEEEIAELAANGAPDDPAEKSEKKED